MLTSRVIPCLDIRGGRIVKGTKFQNLRDAGDPVTQATAYAKAGADELVVLDVSATIEERMAALDVVSSLRAVLNIPITVGGGVRTVADAQRLLEATVDYVAQRHQFGKPVGSYQAVKHHLADVKIAVEFARPLVYRAAWSVAHPETHDPVTRSRDVSMAKARASDAVDSSSRALSQSMSRANGGAVMPSSLPLGDAGCSSIASNFMGTLADHRPPGRHPEAIARRKTPFKSPQGRNCTFF